AALRATLLRLGRSLARRLLRPARRVLAGRGRLLAFLDLHAESRNGLAVDPSAHLQPLLLLEHPQGSHGARPELAVYFSDLEALVPQRDLQLADFIHAQIERAGCTALRRAERRTRGGAGGADLLTGRNDPDDPVAVIDDHDLVTHHEILVTAEFRMDADEHVRNGNEPYAARHHGADANREVHIVNARHVAAGED